MSDYTREQLFDALRRADAAGDADAAKALTQRIKQMDAGGPDAVQAALEAGKSREEILTIAQQNNLTLNEEDLDANLASRDAGRGVAEVQEPSNWDHLADSAANIGTGIAQGAMMAVEFPMEIGRGIRDGISYGATSALDALGFSGAADVERRGREFDQQARLTLPSAQIEQMAPTPENGQWERLGGQLLGGALVPLGPKAAPRPASVAQPAKANPRVRDDAGQVIAEGERRGVPVMTTDIKPPRSGMGRWVKQTVPEKIPVAGTSGPRERQQEARVRAVIEAVEEFGGTTGRALFDNSETLPQEVSRLLTRQRSERLSKLKAAKDGVIDAVQDVAPVTQTLAAIDDQIARMVQRDTPASREVAATLKALRAELAKPRTLRGLEDFRADELSQAFSNPDTLAAVKTVGEKALRAIYDPLRKDMGDFIEGTLGAGDRAKWQKANEELSAMAGELASAKFRNVLRDADMTPEKISRILFSDSENVSDMARLVANLDEAGIEKVRGALITRAFEKAGGKDGVSVERFLNNLDTLSGKIGVAFKGQHRAALDGLRRLLDATRRGAASGANVRTGEQNLPAVLGIGATQIFGFGGGVGTLGIGGLLARIYESPVIRNRLARLGRSDLGSREAQSHIEAISKASIPLVNQWKDDFARIANDNAGHSLAAESDGPEQEREQ